jgi:hypothetical protein
MKLRKLTVNLDQLMQAGQERESLKNQDRLIRSRVGDGRKVGVSQGGDEENRPQNQRKPACALHGAPPSHRRGLRGHPDRRLLHRRPWDIGPSPIPALLIYKYFFSK